MINDSARKDPGRYSILEAFCPPLPYGRQSISDDDIEAVVEALKSDWLTTGPTVASFEKAVASFTGSAEAVAVSSGTAALHAAMFALGIEAGDEVIVPAMTFASTANAVVFQGGTPVFVDVDPDTLLIDPEKIEKKITAHTKAVIAVDYAGQPCNYDALQAVVKQHHIELVADACHSLGGSYRGMPVGSLSSLNVFSFHPVKNITTAEGGMITTDNPELASRMRLFRNHGISSDHREREAKGSWYYEMVDLGYNYRLTDIQCALGLSQIRKLSDWIARRQLLALRYDEAFELQDGISPLKVGPDVSHAYHLYVIRIDSDVLGICRNDIFYALRSHGIGVNVHYIPVHLHPYYRNRFKTGPGLCPAAEEAYGEILSLPLFPAMQSQDQDGVLECIHQIIGTS
ncbi:MAG: UDP-4-amino-4,6-dideoxy-N-acetyl-beta-L-altrosamine transaminase [Deltaproteobacteria bacterium]|nr:UDP-4-amino-4,6-dideoxy-N-acetyl-beta-L-altrosamine transaminase [Deltaproteobacteria bacterium]